MRAVVRSLCLLAIVVGLLLPVAADLARAQQSATVPVVTVEHPVTAARAGFVADAIRTAGDADAPAIVVRVEARSGTYPATATILDAIRDSDVPVLTWVPPGVTVDGPGATVLLSGHVATMAPDAGLAVDAGYSHTANPFDDDDPPRARDAELAGIASDRDRPVDWVDGALAASSTLAGPDARDAGAIDAVAPDLEGVLAVADGQVVGLIAGPESVMVSGASTDQVNPGWLDRVWLFLSQPTVAYLLLCLGAIGLFLELSVPGITFAGVGGLISLVGAVIILGQMPLSWTGLVLIGGGLILLIVDIFVPSLGLLTVGGLVGFVVGSYVLFEGDASDGYMVAPAAIWAVAVSLVVFFVFLAGSSLKAMRKRPATGRDAMVGRIGIARTALAPEGLVFIEGETWRAHALTLHRSAVAPVIGAGAPVIVTRIDGLLLEVRAASKVEVEEAGITMGDPGMIDRRTVVPVGGQPVE